MLWAQLRGKVPSQHERAEDVLTSNVFGALKYIEPSRGLFPILSRAVGTGRETLLEIIRSANTSSTSFWPWIEAVRDNGCEPDVTIHLARETRPVGLIYVEAKYLSGKSSIADPMATTGSQPRDQLAREWINCSAQARAIGVEPFLLFVTADDAIPKESLDESQADLERCGREPARILWLSWQTVCEALDVRIDLLRDLRSLLVERYGFVFVGFTVSQSRLSWRFGDIPSEAFAFAPRSRLPWLFSENSAMDPYQRFQWPLRSSNIWSFHE